MCDRNHHRQALFEASGGTIETWNSGKVSMFIEIVQNPGDQAVSKKDMACIQFAVVFYRWSERSKAPFHGPFSESGLW